ncbi:MAG: neutral/alkaline non-lysosomal ceramidase N-terminal domain-containing protein [Desulfurococcaceae archaeon]
MKADLMNVGYSKATITPMSGVHRLAGYIQRTKPSICVLDDIYVKTIVYELEQGNLLVMSSVDLLAIDEAMVNDMRRIVKEITGSQEIIVAATHTHSAPSTLFRDATPAMPIIEFNEDYYQYFLSSFEKSLQEAYNGVEKAKCTATTLSVQGIATNRNNPSIPIDNNVTVLKCNGNRVKVGVINYGVHPTVLGPDNVCISRDLVGVTEDLLRMESGVDFVFINAAAGDVSTRFTRRNQTYNEVIRIGTLLANNIINGMGSAQWREIEGFSLYKNSKLINLEFDVKKVESISSELFMKLKLVKSHDAGYSRVAESIKEALDAIKLIQESIYRKRSASIMITAYLIDQRLGLIVFPGEALSKIALNCRELAATEIIFAGYANGYYGYFSDKTIPETYEDLMTIFTEKSVRDVYSSVMNLCSWIGELASS